MTQKFFAPVGFRFHTEMLPSLSEWIQRVEVPSLTIPSKKVESPFVPVNIGGDNIVFDDLTITFKLDEDLVNYTEIAQWMQALAFPSSHESYKLWMEKRGKMKGEGVLTLLNAKYNDVGKFNFEDITPTYLSGFELMTDVDNIEYLSVTVRFSYTKTFFTGK